MLLGMFTADFLGKFKSIHVDVLAKSMVAGSLLALDTPAPQKIYEGADLFNIAGTI